MSSIILKVFYKKPDGKKEIRRISIKISQNDDVYKMAVDKIRELFSDLRQVDFQLHWQDSDGDPIVFSCTEEMNEAISQAQDGVLRVYVTVIAASKPSEKGNPKPSEHDTKKQSKDSSKQQQQEDQSQGHSKKHFSHSFSFGPGQTSFSHSSGGNPMGFFANLGHQIGRGCSRGQHMGSHMGQHMGPHMHMGQHMHMGPHMHMNIPPFMYGAGGFQHPGSTSTSTSTSSSTSFSSSPQEENKAGCDKSEEARKTFDEAMKDFGENMKDFGEHMRGFGANFATSFVDPFGINIQIHTNDNFDGAGPGQTSGSGGQYGYSSQDQEEPWERRKAHTTHGATRQEEDEMEKEPELVEEIDEAKTETQAANNEAPMDEENKAAGQSTNGAEDWIFVTDNERDIHIPQSEPIPMPAPAPTSTPVQPPPKPSTGAIPMPAPSNMMPPQVSNGFSMPPPPNGAYPMPPPSNVAHPMPPPPSHAIPMPAPPSHGPIPMPPPNGAAPMQNGAIPMPPPHTTTTTQRPHAPTETPSGRTSSPDTNSRNLGEYPDIGIQHGLSHLMAMGFTDTDGSLTRLLRENRGDVGATIDAIINGSK